MATPLQYSCLENLMDGGAWWATVYGVAKSRTQLNYFTFTFHFHVLGKEMATHSSVLAWRIPGMGEPGGLPPVGWHRVGHDWSNLAATAARLSVESSQLLGLCICISSPWSFLIFPNSCHPGIVPPQKAKVLRLCLDLPKKGNAKECSNYRTIALISYTSNVQNSPSQASAIRELQTSRCSSWC